MCWSGSNVRCRVCYLGNCWISETAPPTILSSSAKSPLTKDLVLIAQFLDQINTISTYLSVVGFSELKTIINNLVFVTYIYFEWRTHLPTTPSCLLEHICQLFLKLIGDKTKSCAVEKKVVLWHKIDRKNKTFWSSKVFFFVMH